MPRLLYEPVKEVYRSNENPSTLPTWKQRLAGNAPSRGESRASAGSGDMGSLPARRDPRNDNATLMQTIFSV